MPARLKSFLEISEMDRRLLLLLSVMYVTKGQRVVAPSDLDTCTPKGGVCTRSSQPCDGYVDEHALGCSKREVCCKPAPVTSHPEPEAPGTDQCGLITRIPMKTSDPRLRVVGGDPAVEGEWPWQVSFSDGRGHFCGGTLVTSQWIVSAAHCFPNKLPSDFNVTLGEHHREYHTGNEHHVKAEKVITHPDYSSIHGLPNDIALVKLTEPVTTSGHYVRTACLPAHSDVFDEQDYCYVTGWGYTQGTGDNLFLHHLQIGITSLKACNESWDGIITDKNICLGTGNIGACQGDSGGPLVCLRNSHYVLAGATSWGSMSCMADGYPNVYTKITPYLRWIESYIRNE